MVELRSRLSRFCVWILFLKVKWLLKTAICLRICPDFTLAPLWRFSQSLMTCLLFGWRELIILISVVLRVTHLDILPQVDLPIRGLLGKLLGIYLLSRHRVCLNSIIIWLISVSNIWLSDPWLLWSLRHVCRVVLRLLMVIIRNSFVRDAGKLLLTHDDFLVVNSINRWVDVVNCDAIFMRVELQVFFVLVHDLITFILVFYNNYINQI